MSIIAFKHSGPIRLSGEGYPDDSPTHFINTNGGSVSAPFNLSGVFEAAMDAGILLSGSASYAPPHAMSEFYGMYITSAIPSTTGSGCCILLETGGCILLETGDCGVVQLEICPKLPDNEQLAYPGGLFTSSDYTILSQPEFHFDGSILDGSSWDNNIDNGSGVSTWGDRAGGATNHDATQGTAASQPVFNNAGYLECDGSDDSLSIANPVDLTSGKEYTLAIVAEKTSAADNYAPVGGDYLSPLNRSDGNTYFIDGTNAVVSTGDYGPHFTGTQQFNFTKDASGNFKYYLQGNIPYKSGIHNITETSAFSAIGENGSYHHGGKVYEIIMWKKALDALEMNIVRRYFDNKYDQACDDLPESTPFECFTEEFASKNAMSTSDSTAYLDSNSNLDHILGGSFTLSSWIKLDSIGTVQEIMGALSLPNPWFEFRVSTTGNIELYLSDDGGGFRYGQKSNTSLTAGVWYHLSWVVDRDSQTSKLYVNGESATLSAITSYNATIPSTGGTWLTNAYIGARNYTSKYPINNIDDTSMFDYALCANEIKGIYNNGSPRDISYLNPNNWWWMGDPICDLAENAPTAIKDHGTHGDDITVNGTYTLGSAKGPFSKYSIQFADTTQRVENDTTSIDAMLTSIGTGDISFSTWFKFDSLTDSQYLIYMGAVNVSYDFMSLRYNEPEEKIEIRARAGSTGQDITLSDAVIQVGEWYHIVGVRSGTTGKIYVNGVMNSSTGTEFGVSLGNQTAGVSTDFRKIGFGGIGRQKEIAIWDTALSDEDVYSLYNYGLPNNLSLADSYETSKTANLKLWWRMGDNNNGAGTTITDQSGGGYDGTVAGDPDFIIDHPNGHKNLQVCLRDTETNILARSQDRIGRTALGTDTDTLYVFDGSDWQLYGHDESFSNIMSVDFAGLSTKDRIDTTYVPTLSSSATTVSMWVKSSNITDSIGFVSNSNVSGSGGSLKLLSPSGTKSFYVIINDGASTYTNNNIGGANASLDIRDGLWHHLAISVNGTSIKIYLDGGDAAINAGNPTNNQGTPFATATSTVSYNVPTSDPYVIGTNGKLIAGNLYWMDGLIDEVAFWESELSGVNISTIYNNGLPNSLSPLNPVAWYRMGDVGDTNDGGSPASAGSIIGVIADQIGSADATVGNGSPIYSSDTP